MYKQPQMFYLVTNNSFISCSGNMSITGRQKGLPTVVIQSSRGMVLPPSQTSHQLRGKIAVNELLLAITWSGPKWHPAPPLTTHLAELVTWLHPISRGQEVQSYHVPKVWEPEIFGEQHQWHQWPSRWWQWSSSFGSFSKPLPICPQTCINVCLSSY